MGPLLLLLFQHLAQDGSGASERRLAILGWQGAEAHLQAALQSLFLSFITSLEESTQLRSRFGLNNQSA